MQESFQLEKSIEENLYELFGKDMELARDGEIYTSLAKTVRALLGRTWTKTIRKYRSDKVHYLLSFEYTLGNILLSNLIKLGILDDVIKIFERNNRDFKSILKNDSEFALGFSDLGILTGIGIEEFAIQNENVYAYGLRYRKGMLKQEIINGGQVEKPDDWKVDKNPWEHEKDFSHIVKMKNNTIKAIPYDIPILGKADERVNTLRIWKSESINDIDFAKFSDGKILEAYAGINKANAIVEFLYPQEDSPNGRRLRLSQEYFFASACIQDILKKFKKYKNSEIADIGEFVTIQICDIHPLLSILVFIDEIMLKYQLSFDEAYGISKKVFIFSNSSFLPENFESWELSLVEEVAPNLVNIIMKIDKKEKTEVRRAPIKNLDLAIIKNGYVNLFNIAYYVPDRIRFFSQNHLNYLKENFPSHYLAYRHKCKIYNTTFNPNLYISEVNPKLLLYKEKCDPFKIEKLKYENKLKLVDFLKYKNLGINPKSIFIAKVGVFHEYKRQLLSALSIALLYLKLKKNANIDMPERTYFFGGKSYPNYMLAKEMIKFINSLAFLINNDLTIKGKIKIVFIENYDIKKSNYLIPATEIVEEVSFLPMEYTDFSLTKFIINGALVLAGEKSLLMEHQAVTKNIYRFEGYKQESDFSVYDYLARNPIINDLFNFLRHTPRDKFPYDIDKIYNYLIHFNDPYRTLRDLFNHYDAMEKICKDYYKKSDWNSKSLDNINRGMKVLDNIKIVER